MPSLQDQINEIQAKRNFHPKLGAKQLPDNQEIRADYSALVALLEQAKTQGISASVPHGLGEPVPLADVNMGKLQGPRQRPIAPKKGTFAWTKWKIAEISALHPEVPHADLLWASKRVDIENAAELVTTAKARVHTNGT
jgi:hypothetical protein